MERPGRSSRAQASPHPTTRTTVLASLLALVTGACAGTYTPARQVPNVRAASARASSTLAASVPLRPGATRMADLLVGRVAGVQVVDYGDVLSVRVRGGVSIGGGEPLLVLDGLPIPGTGRALATLNPADVARIEVLKDPASTSVYGVRGANGVIVITTRQAKTGTGTAGWRRRDG